MENRKIICPFCGIDIISNHTTLHSILQKETVKRNFSIESNWARSYLKETKYTRNFSVFCCEHCYIEYLKYNKWSDRYAMFAAPIGFLAGVSYCIYMIITKDLSVSFARILGCILYGILGIYLFLVPNIFLYFIYGKKTSYKHASKCNAIEW